MSAHAAATGVRGSARSFGQDTSLSRLMVVGKRARRPPAPPCAARRRSPPRTRCPIALRRLISLHSPANRAARSSSGARATAALRVAGPLALEARGSPWRRRSDQRARVRIAGRLAFPATGRLRIGGGWIASMVFGGLDLCGEQTLSLATASLSIVRNSNLLKL